ncbi:uncharacterized protein BXZ73DRAFT_98746 [Epithele typhae]|uniref:uncharacterized protein n=1 Tax=Epithele typhae TaxID=378194 RepID=UPI0020088CDA|nr:uncharacterized protein BXZ73DRAFT_98746 [Epithele typhae]KAH9940916.1 hypothetical protein BXZ73DRAFT_98746 [Epithele typhae]
MSIFCVSVRTVWVIAVMTTSQLLALGDMSFTTSTIVGGSWATPNGSPFFHWDGEDYVKAPMAWLREEYEAYEAGRLVRLANEEREEGVVDADAFFKTLAVGSWADDIEDEEEDGTDFMPEVSEAERFEVWVNAAEEDDTADADFVQVVSKVENFKVWVDADAAPPIACVAPPGANSGGGESHAPRAALGDLGGGARRGRSKTGVAEDGALELPTAGQSGLRARHGRNRLSPRAAEGGSGGMTRSRRARGLLPVNEDVKEGQVLGISTDVGLKTGNDGGLEPRTGRAVSDAGEAGARWSTPRAALVGGGVAGMMGGENAPGPAGGTRNKTKTGEGTREGKVRHLLCLVLGRLVTALVCRLLRSPGGPAPFAAVGNVVG